MMSGWIIVISLSVLITLLSLRRSQPKKPTFTIVKKYDPLQLPAGQRMLYDALINQGYYVTCSFLEKRTIIPLAMEPFRIALIQKDKALLNYVIKYVYLKYKGWLIIPFSAECNDDQIQQILSDIERIQNHGLRRLKQVQ